MTTEHKSIRSHLTLIEVLIALMLLGTAGFFLVRGMGIAKEREQRRHMAKALELWDENDAYNHEAAFAENIFTLIRINPKLHDAKSRNGLMPLHIATSRGDRDIAKWLLDHGADVNAKDNRGYMPLYSAAARGDEAVTELLLARGANVNAKGGDGWTPLHLAACNGHKEVAELLLVKGADMNAKGFNGWTPLDWAKEIGRQEMIDLLLKHGAKE